MLVLHCQKDTSWFVIVCNDEHLQVLHIIYIDNFVNCLLGKAGNCKWIQNIYVVVNQFYEHKKY